MRTMFRILFVGVLALTVPAVASMADEPAPATETDVREAYEVLQAWINAFAAGDNETHLALTHPRIRYWHPMRRWADFMDDAREINGRFLHYEVVAAGPMTAEQLPCTEMRHCYRDGLRYVAFFIETEYEKVSPEQPEYAVMAWSEEGWRFGGGTILNRPMGETMVILDRVDEQRFRTMSDGMRQ